MSWSVMFIGKPNKIAEALIAEANKMSGQSKEEYERALPHITALVQQNFVKEGSGQTEPIIKLNAGGSGYTRDGEQLSGSVTVHMEFAGGTFVG